MLGIDGFGCICGEHPLEITERADDPWIAIGGEHEHLLHHIGSGRHPVGSSLTSDHLPQVVSAENLAEQDLGRLFDAAPCTGSQGIGCIADRGGKPIELHLVHFTLADCIVAAFFGDNGALVLEPQNKAINDRNQGRDSLFITAEVGDQAIAIVQLLLQCEHLFSQLRQVVVGQGIEEEPLVQTGKLLAFVLDRAEDAGRTQGGKTVGAVVMLSAKSVL